MDAAVDTDPNRLLGPHKRNRFCVDGVCDNDMPPTLFDDEDDQTA